MGRERHGNVVTNCSNLVTARPGGETPWHRHLARAGIASRFRRSTHPCRSLLSLWGQMTPFVVFGCHAAARGTILGNSSLECGGLSPHSKEGDGLIEDSANTFSRSSGVTELHVGLVREGIFAPRTSCDQTASKAINSCIAAKSALRFS